MRLKTEKFVSILIVISLLLNGIQPIFYVNAEEDEIVIEAVETRNDTKSPPQIDIEYLGTTPKNPIVGQEFTLKYKVNPQPFRMSFAKDLEIVFVLDNSEGMGKHEYLENVKKSTLSFINSFTELTDGVTKFQNLNIGLVSFNSTGTIEQVIIPIIRDGQVQNEAINQAMSAINNLTASGQKNMGDGLRKTAYLLSQNPTDMERAIILLTEGALDAATVESKQNSIPYLKIDNLDPGEGNNSTPYLYTGCKGNDSKCNDYAINMAKMLKSNLNHVFSIMIGGSSENSNHHAHLPLIHTALGGEGKPFYAGINEIQIVFDQIAQELEKLYSINPILNITLNPNFSLQNEFNLKVDPVNYTLGTDGWYTAPSQIIEITMTANDSGDYSLFDAGSFGYKDIHGNNKESVIDSPTISVRPYDSSQESLLTVDFQFIPNKALIGDEVEAVLTMIPPIGNNEYSGLGMWLPNIDSNLRLIGNNSLNLGEIKDGQIKSGSFRFLITERDDIVSDHVGEYTLTGESYYNNYASQHIIERLDASVYVKRGRVKARVIDESGQNITSFTTLTLDDFESNEMTNDGYIIFDTVPTGNYFLELSNLPNGCYVDSGDEKANITVNYDNNEITYTFHVKGKIASPFRILEVEPADSFKLTNQSGRVTTGVELTTVMVDNKNYITEIHHMTMSEFIAKTTKINGYYDVIVIGDWIDYSISANNNTTFNSYQYLENDITNRKSEEIKQFIETGQLVYIDSNLKWRTDLKLGKNFSENGIWTIRKENFNGSWSLQNANNQLTLRQIIDDYLKIKDQAKRPNFSVEVSEGDSFSDELGNREKRKMKFKLNTDLTNAENLTINLYLDINGDGLFKEEEKFQFDKVNFYQENGTSIFELEYDFYKDFPEFVGLLDWKVEIEKDKIEGYSNAIVSYQQGNILFRRLGDKRTINVLQISPYARGDIDNKIKGNLNLVQHEEFQNLLKVNEVQDYIINIDVISYEEFYGEKYSKFENEVDLKDSKYDMIIIGFSDNYQLNMFKDNEEAIRQIREFIESGQSVMFTHDTFYNSYTDDIVNTNYGSGFAFTKSFRDIIGQSRYWDPNNANELDIDGDLIPHDLDQPTDINSYNPGFTTWRRDTGDGAMWNSVSSSVYQLNQSLITSYPFQLGESISIRKTHGQYFQLNLEDEDVVPLFTLENSSERPNINRYDAMNSYYTYSKGNITFSGTGENTRDSNGYPESELKLFINTIVKAERGANHAPVIDSNLIEYQDNIIYKGVKEFDFTVTVKDVDSDLMNVGIDFYVEDPRINPNAKSVSLLKEFDVSSGESFDLKVPNKNTTMYLKVMAEDEHGASTTKVYVVVPSDYAIPFTVTGNKGLVGEELDLNIQFNMFNASAAKFQMDENNTVGIQFLDDNFASQKEMTQSNSELSYRVTGTREVDGYLTGTIIYSDESKQVVKIPISIVEPEILVKLEFTDGVEAYPLEVTLLKNTDFLETKVITESAKFKNGLTVGNGYRLNIGNLSEGVSVIKTDIKDMKNNLTQSEINLNYDSPIYECILTIGTELLVESSIEHGLFLGLNQMPILDVDEGLLDAELKDFPLNSVVALGAVIEAGEDSMLVKFHKDVNGNLIGTPKVIQLEPDSNEEFNCSKSTDGNFTCQLGSKGTYVLTYHYKLSVDSFRDDFYIFRNTISLNDSEYSKVARIKVSKLSNLPNLF